MTVSPGLQRLDHVAAERLDDVQHLNQEGTGRVLGVPGGVRPDGVQLSLLVAQCLHVLAVTELIQHGVVGGALGHQLVKSIEVRLQARQVVDVPRCSASLALRLRHRRPTAVWSVQL